ncbi:MAG: cobalamin-dependent protein, partial [Desulfobacteraceae bacterium]|nr:cobalamin-dependent protein [Desulfobacteraceae bacterium]
FYSMNWGRFIKLKPHMVYVYSFLKEFFDVTVIDLENEFSRPETDNELDQFKKKALQRILSVDTDYLAISCWSSLNYLSSKYFANKIKGERPNTKIIVGGYHPTFVSEDFEYKHSPFDYVVKGEIQNILKIFRHKKYDKSETQQITPDFISYPYFNSQKTVGIFLGTGCPFKCSFCMEYKRKWSGYPVVEAIELISKIEKEISPKYIAIFDACFGVDKNWRRELLSELVRKNIQCYFWLETRVDLIDEEDLELMSRLNLKIDFGVDSFSKTMLRIMNKTKDPDSYLKKLINVSRKCNELKILHDIFLMFNHPGESKKTYEEHRKFLEDQVLRKLKGGYLRIMYQRFSFFPGSYVFNHAADFENKYGFNILYPQWWKERENHYIASRSVTPSTDERGDPFFVPLKELSKEIKDFNKMSKERDLWEKLHAFDL